MTDPFYGVDVFYTNQILQEQPIVRMSSEWTWKTDKDEIFDCGAMAFDVTVAKEIIQATPREVVSLDIQPHVALLELVVRTGNRKTDLTVPVIVGTLKNGGRLLLDGWHRIKRASVEGLVSLPAVLLDREETVKCRYRGDAVRKARRRR